MKSGVYKKIFYSFSIIIVLYTFIILFVFVTKEISRQQYESKMEVEFYLERESSRIDSQIETAIDSTQMLADNKIVQELASVKETDYRLYSEIFDQVKENLFSGYQLGYNLGITQGAEKTVVGPNGYFDFNDYLQFIGLPIDNAEIADFFRQEDRNRIQMFSTNQNLYLLRKIYQPGQPASLYFIVNWHKKNLVDQDVNYREGQLYFLDAEASELDLKKEANQLLPFIPFNPAVKNRIGNQQVGREVAFWKQSSVMPSLSYIFILPKSALSKLPTDTIWLTVAVLAGLLIMGSLLSIYFSRSSYRPYKKIITEIQNDSSDAFDVEAVLAKIEGWKTANHDLSKFREENIEEIREVFFKNILIGKYTREDLTRIIQILGMQTLQAGGLIVILSIAGRTTAEADLSERELMKARQKIIEYATDKKGIQLFIQPINYEKFALIYSTKNQDAILEKIAALRNVLSNELFISSNFVMSVPFESLEQFSITFRDVISLNAATTFKTEEIIVNRTLTKGTNYVYSVEAEQRLVHLVKSKQISEASQLIESILRTNFIEKSLATHSVEDLKQALINTLKRITQIIGTDYGVFYNNNRDLFDRLIRTDYRDLYRVFMSIFQEVFSIAEDSGEETYAMMDRVLKHIDRHYREDLSLSDLADQFHLTESYVSKLIKEATGIPFKNYLNQLKVNKAKELLAAGDLQVNQVAEEVGCKNVNTFIRMFKQYEGVTPGKYQGFQQQD
ncbi:two-component system response regulator YesN [Enterococcus sp. PF1-24]|uniref:helix-turn-helix domain-containing protein n=1 Tax=unclassified Enterococcus TaxID=2608891 RepID=UPI002473DC9F|nr:MULTISPECIES: AraC family transcriptional regulator [unclassified Enterococcus]MDH6364661.1 two-component system response regulator YesN [Enterococcus sp. PFB1-1]MDH6401762.1 two-component system response regulator YesN [Enterococcus sp. PF1-24]